MRGLRARERMRPCLRARDVAIAGTRLTRLTRANIRGGSQVEELSLWDAQIQDVCAAVNDVLDEAVAKGLVGDDSVAMA